MREEELAEGGQEEQGPLEIDVADALTAHFRRTSRGRVVNLPRWAQ